MGHSVIEFVLDILENHEMKGILKRTDNIFNELKDIDVMNNVMFLEDNGSDASVKEVDGSSISVHGEEVAYHEKENISEEVKKDENDNKSILERPSINYRLSQNEKKTVGALFEMLTGVFSHFVMKFVFSDEVRDLIVDEK